MDSVFNWIPKLYGGANKKTRIIREQTWSGLTPAESWDPNGESVPESSMMSRYRIEANAEWIANSISYTLDMKTFDEHNIMPQLAADLGNSIATRRQLAAVGLLCAGFSTAWNAEANENLFATGHNLDPRAGNLTVSNLVQGAPSVATLSEAITLLTGMRDDMGNPDATFQPRFVLCHPNKYLEWKQIIGNDAGRSDTANHTPNPFDEFHLKAVACPWITDEKMWFLFANKTGLIWNEIIPFVTKMETDHKTQVTSHLAYSCFTQYARDWRGIVGSQG